MDSVILILWSLIHVTVADTVNYSTIATGFANQSKLILNTVTASASLTTKLPKYDYDDWRSNNDSVKSITVSDKKVLKLPNTTADSLQLPLLRTVVANSNLLKPNAAAVEAVVLIIPCKRWWLKRQKETDSRWSFYATETEPRAWDSLSFSQSITDLSTSKFQPWESLSDDSCINTLNEVISQRASVMKANSKRNCGIIPKLRLPQSQRVSVIPDPSVTLTQT
uniref:C-type lectin domain-containing protein n=1 Tax=Syphacia muris TaxID=451379 RepID=A0A0N5ANC9_9BILA